MDKRLIEKLKGFYEIQHSDHAALYSMEGLRGLAVFLVFLVHYINYSEAWIVDSGDLYQYTSMVRSLGNVGVDLFFVLSGYLIYGSLILKERPFVPYLWRRIERIYPTFSDVFILYLILSIIFPAQSKLPDGAIDTIVYVAENYLLLPGMLKIDAIVTVAWSLSYEFFFYLSVPLLIFALRLRRWSSINRAAFFLVLSVAILTFPDAFGGHIRLAMFISGILVFEVSSFLRSPAQLDLFGFVGLSLALAGSIAQVTYGFSGQWKFAVLAISFFLLCWACFSLNGFSSKFISWTPLRWLGNISYSYYLIHGLILNALFLVLPKYFAPTGENHIVFWSALPLCFAATFIGLSFLFLWVEKPLSIAKNSLRNVEPEVKKE